MNINKKKILTIALVLLVVLLGGASVYVATQLSTRKAVAPTAPESKPKAAELTYVGSDDCTTTGTATAAANIALNAGKWAYKDAYVSGTSKTISKAMPGETIVYRIGVENTSDATISGVRLTDVLDGENQNLLTYVSSKSETSTGECSYSSASKTLSCVSGSISPKRWYLAQITLKVADSATDGLIIRNTVTTSLGNVSDSATHNLTVGSWSVTKEAFNNDSSNTAGSYKHAEALKKTGDTAVIAPGETFTYLLWANNPSTSTMSGTLTLTDVLTGDGMDKLTFVDADNGCTYSSSSRTVKCTMTRVDPGTWGKGFRVKVADDITDGVTVKNTVTAKYINTTKEASNTLTTQTDEEVTLTGSKTAYKNVTANTAGNYTLSTEMSTVSKSQTFVYSIKVTNTSDKTASEVVMKDSLAENTNLTFVDAVPGCNWSAANKELTCTTSIKPDETKTFNFRVKAGDALVNGEVIKNTANVTYDNKSLTLTKDLPISTVVGCNHTCTTDEECSAGLTCDATTSKCRKSACLTEDDCTCGVAVVATATKAPTATKTPTVTKVATAAATPMALTEAGIFNIPGVAAFGGGLLLAVVGILLAL